MSLLSKMGSAAYQAAASKSVRKSLSSIAGVSTSKPVRTAATKTISTTSKISGLVSPVLAGGRKIATNSAKTVAKGVGGIGVVGGKLILPATLVGTGVVASTAIYDYTSNVLAKTPAQRQDGNTLDLMDKGNQVQKEAMDNEIAYMNQLAGAAQAMGSSFKDIGVPSDQLAQSMVSPLRLLGNQSASGSQFETQKGGFDLSTLLLLGGVGGLVYYFTKKKK